MEPLGLAVGFVGVAGLYSSVVEVAKQIDTYKKHKEQSNVLNAQFNAIRVRLEHWGRAVGIDQRKPAPVGTPLAHESFPRTEVEEVTALSIRELLEVADEILHAAVSTNGTVDPHVLRTEKRPELSASKRKRLGWSIKGKLNRVEQVNTFAFVVQQLHELLPLPTEATQEVKEMAQEVSQLVKDMATNSGQMNDIFQLMDEIRSDKRINDATTQTSIRTWLLGPAASDTTNFEKYESILNERLEGTCDWILNRPEFRQWIDVDPATDASNLLWVNGHAGFGKTILCAHIIDHLTKTQSMKLAYFFSSSQSGGWEDAYVILRSWLAQLCIDDEKASGLVFDAWAFSKIASNTATRQQIVRALGEVLRVSSRCVLVIDGLDECSVPASRKSSNGEMLRDLLKFATRETRILITSREKADIREALASGLDNKRVAELAITTTDVEADNLALSQDIIAQWRSLHRQHGIDREKLSHRMTERCSGQMLWLAMQRNAINNARTAQHLEDAINETPAGVFEAYERTWEEIHSRTDCEALLRIIRWVIFAHSDLTVGALLEAALIDEASSEVKLEEPLDEIDQHYVDIRLNGLYQMIKIQMQPGASPANWKVSPAHFTVKEFLLSRSFLPTRPKVAETLCKPESDMLPEQIERVHSIALARQCLIYIGSKKVWEDDTSVSPESAPPHRYLREYAANTWAAHIGSGHATDLDEKTTQAVLNFMTPTHPCWELWQKQQYEFDRKYQHESEPAHPTYLAPLHYSILFGLIGILQKQVAHKGFAFQQSLLGFSALHWASVVGDLLAVEILIRGGTYPDLQSGEGTPLCMASSQGHIDIVRLLLESGADINACALPCKELKKIPPIYLAAIGGHSEIVRLLFNEGARLDIPEPKRSSVQEYHRGIRSVIFHMVDRHNDIDDPRPSDCQSLIRAVRSGNSKLLKTLLQTGADMTIVDDERHWSPVHHSVSRNDLRCLEALESSSQFASCVDTVDMEAETALHIATRNKSHPAIQLLVEHGANTEIQNKYGSSPVHIAASAEDTRSLELLARSNTFSSSFRSE